MQMNGRSGSTFRFGPLQACLVALAGALLVLAGAADGRADVYPNRPVRIIVPTQAGAAQDIIARLLQPYLEKAFGQPVIVENRSGASTMIGTDAVAKAAPDGHTLLIVPTTFTVNAALNAKLTFDFERDFAPITVLAKNPLLFAVKRESAGAHAGGARCPGEGGPGQVQLRQRRAPPPRLICCLKCGPRVPASGCSTSPIAAGRRRRSRSPRARPARPAVAARNLAADRGWDGAPACHRRADA